MHQSLIQWQGDQVEIVQADKSVNVTIVDLSIWKIEGIDCLSGKVWECDFLKVSDCNIQSISDGEPQLLI